MPLTINVEYIHSLGLPEHGAASVPRAETARAVLRDTIDSIIQTAIGVRERAAWYVDVCCSANSGVDVFVLVTELQTCFPGTTFDYRIYREGSGLYRIHFH